MAFTCRVQYLDDTDPFASTVFPEPTRPPSFTFNEYLPLIDQLPAVCKFLKAPHKLEDCTLQLSHNGYYLDIESSIDEQKDDFEGFNKERKHSVILRSQLSVRVHACIEKLLNSTGRELRRALFSLKQIFQDDKDLVHEFVSADGLACLIKVGTDADQNYQNYILRALGQIMLYVDGMNGVIEHTDTVQWLYSLLSSKYRLVVKTSLKLLLVFVEYSESNATVLYQATCVVDKEQGKQTWSNVMNLLKDEGQDSEILVYTMSLINKTLNAIPDQDTFYDITDSLEQEGIEETTKQLMSGKGTDLDLVEQFKLYEYSLKKEDGDIDIPVERKHNLRKHRRSAETADRKSLRRSLKPTAEYGGDRRELRRSLDLGKELTPQDADRVHDSNRRRDNRRSRPRVSIDNSSLSSEMTVKEQLEERKARLRVPDRDGSSREDTSAGTTDFSASENSSTKIPWRRGRIRQASAPGDIIAKAIPQPNELRPVPANKPESSQGAGELQQVLAERRRRRREMRQEKEVEDAPTVEGWVSQAGKANQEEISLKAKLRPVSAKLRNTPDEEPAQPKNPPKKGSGFASLMSKFSSGNDKQKVPSEGLDQAGGLAQVKGQSSHDRRKGSEVKTEDEEQTFTMKLPAAGKVAASKEQKVDNEQEEVRNRLTEGNLEDIKEELEDAVSEEAIERLRRGGLRYDPYTYASSETGTTATPIHPSSSMSSLAGYDTVSVTTDGGDADRESMIVSDSEGYLTLPEEDADNHTPQGITEDEVSSVKPAHPNIVSSSEVSMTSLKSNDGENSIKRRDNGSRNKRQEEEDEDDIMMLLSVGLAPPDDFQKHQGQDQDEVSWLSEEDDTRCSSSLDGTYTGEDEQQPKVLANDENASKVASVTKTPSTVKGNLNFKFAQLPNTTTPGPTKKVKPSDEDDDDLMALLSQGLPGPEDRDDDDLMALLSQGLPGPEDRDDDDESSLGSDTEEGVSEIGSLDGITDASFVQTFYDSPAKPGYDDDISNTNRLAKTTFVKTDGLKNLQQPEPVQKTKQKLDRGQKTKMNHKKDDENELMALLSGGLPSEESSTSKKSVMDRAPKEVQNGEESRVPKINLNEVKGDNLSTKLDKYMRQVKSFKQDDGDVIAKVGKGLKPPLVAKKQEDKKIIEKSKKDASSKRKQEEDDEDVLSLLSQGFSPVIPEPEKASSQRHIPQNESKEGKTDLGRGGRKRPEVNKEDDVLAMLSQGIPATPDEEEEGNRNQNASQTFQPRFRVASMDDTNQDVQSPNWRKDNDKPKFVIRNTYHDPPVRPFSSKKGDSEKPSGSSWPSLSNDKGFSPYKTFTPSALLYGDDAASKWLSRANPKPIQIPLGNQSLRHFDRPKKSTQSEASSVTPGENDVKPSGSTEESARSSEPNNVPTRQVTSPIRQDTSPARQPTYDALLRTRPGSDTTSTSTRRKPEDDIPTTPTRRKPTIEDDTTYTSRSRSRPSTDDSPSRVKPTEEDTTPSRRRHRPESIPESPSVSTPAATPTNTTTPTSPSETDYITERRRRRKEREAQRAAEAAAAEAAEKQTATLPRNFKPADITPPLTTTEYVSHRRRRTREDVPEETVSTNITSRPAEVSSPVENGDVSSSSSRRRRRQSKGDKTPTESKEAEPEDIQELMAPDYLSGGIAARRKLRQEQREREQLEKERLEKEQREKELAEKAKDERKDIIKRPVPIIREPTPSTSEEQDEKDKQGQSSSSPASMSKVVGMSNGDSSEAISPQISRTASPERDEVFAKTPKPSSETNHVEPSSKKTEPAKDISDKLSKEKKEAVKLTVDTTTKPEEDKVKGNEPPMSAGLSNNKRYQLAMMYSNRTSQDEATVSSPTRKVSTSLQSNETISDRIDQLRNGPVKDEDGDKESPKTPKEIEVTPGKVQAVQEKLQSPGPMSGEKEKFAGPTGDKSGAIGLAKHGLKSVNIPMKQPAVPVNKPETAEEREDAQWEEILRQNNRELRVHNWDFTDLTNQDDQNVFLIKSLTEIEGVVPAPPPLPMGGGMPPPPPAPPMMPPGHYGTLPPPPPPLSGTSINDGYNTYPPKKKKTVRLFWKETRLDRLAMYGKKDPKETIWGVLGDVTIDKRKLEHLFESKAKEILQKDQKILEAGKKHVISVLDPKRSNHINIALTALPHPSTIKQAIMKMDGTAVNKEGIEKLLTMVPSEEESNLIKESMILNPDIPLGSAEQFLYMLSNITVLKARLSLWLFKMDYESMEEEVAEPLAELKKGIEDLKTNETFRHILSMLLAVGNFLNGAQIQGFHIDYLAKVPDIKDTVHKQSLLYHLCTMVIEQFPESSDLFSELASISRCAKVDFEVLETNLQKMEEQCTSSWEHLRVISKHDSHSPLKNRLQDFLSDCAQRIIVLKIVHRRVMNRFNQLLLYLGMTASSARETKKTEFCKIISEFALEYRTTRERVLEQEKKKANHRKRAMTRGKMITENLTLSQDKEEDAKLKALLKNHVGTAPGSETLKTRTRQKPTLARQGGLEVDSEVVNSSDNLGVESQTDNDDTDAGHSATTANMEDVGDEQTDEMLQILVNTAKNTKTRNTPRERKRGRTNRKSLRRTLKGGTGLTEAESRALGLHPACKTGVQV
ncbi:FH1/FH2 domain-containing protein 3-like isoform X4 [Asterias rubens]|uniref:FH1/FH2 domain-containing protein 3-like isoform X4 n=1 Tax=Asterias rubens TaxID=7604 RepID=UPI001455A064|nr:FH1/FH2 domain-containing protein 3-like isoform X4 [Asterias rubens]